MQTSDDGREEIRDRQPQVDRDVLGEPVGKRALESVEDCDGECQGSEDGEHDQIEGPQCVDDDRCGGEGQLQYVG